MRAYIRPTRFDDPAAFSVAYGVGTDVPMINPRVSPRGGLSAAPWFPMSAHVVWLNAQSIIYSIPKLLLAPEIPFSSLDRNMSEQELDLIQFAAGQVAQTGTRPTTIPSSG